MATATSTRRIGDVDVFPIGLGEMPLSVEGRPDEADAIRVVHAALDAGVTLIDTADAYCLGEEDFGHGEALVARALRAWGGDPDDVLVATKGGHTRTGTAWTLDGRPEYLRSACDASLRRLGVEAIGLWQFHRPDPDVPLEESVGVLVELLDAGKVRLAGVSNFSCDEIRMAHEALGGRLAAVQNEFSPRFRTSEDELRLCAELGIAFLPWSPLGGMSNAAGLGEEHAAFAEVAREHGVSPQQVCLAWELAKAEVVVPIPGSSRAATILDSVAAASLELSDDELARLD
jgi:aryl-alcohol dehydrogenase-like predicted oxidoreductase